MATYRKFLVVRADGDMRVVGRHRLRADECAYPLVVNMPNEWGKVLTDQTITVTMPKPPTVQKGKPA